MNEIEISKIITLILIMAGTFLSLVTSFGLIRLPDLYTRTHAASKSSTLGITLILVGVLIYFLDAKGYLNARLLLGIVFLLITGPVGGHLIGRAAYNTNVPLWKGSVHDELEKQKKKSTS